MLLREDAKGLAKKIREGISGHGVHVLYKKDLETYFRGDPDTEENMRLEVNKFAQDYGFKAQISIKQMTALFRESAPV